MERPLWQAWLGGDVAGLLVAGLWVSRTAPAGWTYAAVGAALLAGSAVGAGVATAAGWRLRWLAASLLSAAFAGGAALLMTVFVRG